jgi:hypothetical protein
MSHALHASCLCGEVRWEVAGPLRQPRPDAPDAHPRPALFLAHCHCGRCRKAHGAPYATYLMVPEGRLRVTRGQDRIVRWASIPGIVRPFCATCGSVVPSGIASDGFVWSPAGPFDDPLGVVPTAHIFVGSKAPWVEIDDALPRFDEDPDPVRTPSVETRAPVDPDTGVPRGSCLCGGVAYVVTAPPLRCRTCHCSRCRKAGSAARVSYLATSFEGVRFTRGEDRITIYAVPGARYFKHAFCKVCGSTMPRKDADRGVGIVPMGSLDDDPGARPGSHIYVGSRAAWDSIDDALPRYEENGPG